MSAPRLTDAHALALHRARAARSGDDAWFLHDEAAWEVGERLADIRRRFERAVVVTPFPERFGSVVPGAVAMRDDPVLDLEAGAQDLVVHFMGLHWADDPVGQLVQCRRALRPDGLLLACCFGGDTLHELRAALGEAEAAVSGGLSPRVAPMGEVRALGALLQRAELALPVADVVSRRVRYRDTLHLMRDLRAMGETNALAQRRRVAPGRDFFPAAARVYRDSFPDGDGIRATFETVFLTGWSPSDTQQKPLRPGSAQARLAGALGVDEGGDGR